MSRIWSFLYARRVGGVGYCTGPSLPLRDGGSLRLPCLVCVAVGVNITVEDILNTPNILMHTIQILVTEDGNFLLNQYVKQGDKHDATLWKGHGYTVDEEVLAKYIKLDHASDGVSIVQPSDLDYR